MSRGLSLYLDLLRFALALEVLLAHFIYRGYTPAGFLWFVWSYAQTAVIGFFVLSGYVIAHVTTGRETTTSSYVIARVARLYSVVLPALALTWLLDSLGSALSPASYATGPATLGAHQPLRYLLSASMLQDFGILGLPGGKYSADWYPGSNTPFWSMSFEATYYALFAFALFLRGRARIVSCGVLAVLAGPAIMALFPVWLLGVAAYHVQQRVRLPVALAAVGFVVSIGLILLVGWQRDVPRWAVGWPWIGRLLHLDYAEGLLFAVNILMANRLSVALDRSLNRFAPVVRWLGGLTFAMYLCHRPVMHFLALPNTPGAITVMDMVRVLGGVLIVVAAMAWLTDALRHWMRTRLKDRFASVTAPAT